MGEKRAAAALVDLAVALAVLYATDSQARARFYLGLTKASMWSAERLGRLAMAAELRYRREVM